MIEQRILDIAFKVFDDFDTGEAGTYIQLDVVKFAKLVAKECAELTLDYKSPDYYNGWLDYRDEIKKHFGVEE